MIDFAGILSPGRGCLSSESFFHEGPISVLIVVLGNGLSHLFFGTSGTRMVEGIKEVVPSNRDM